MRNLVPWSNLPNLILDKEKKKLFKFCSKFFRVLIVPFTECRYRCAPFALPERLFGVVGLPKCVVKFSLKLSSKSLRLAHSAGGAVAMWEGRGF